MSGVTVIGSGSSEALFDPGEHDVEGLEDRATQLAMGSFVGTFVYSMALLMDVHGESELGSAFVPALSIYIAFALVLFSVGDFIHYIDHMAQAIRVITIMKRVAAETHRAIRRMYPEGVLEGAAEPVAAPQDPPSLIVHHEDRGGVLCAVDEEALMKLARETSTIVAVVPMPGEFVPHGASLVPRPSSASARRRPRRYQPARPCSAYSHSGGSGSSRTRNGKSQCINCASHGAAAGQKNDRPPT